MNASPAPGTTPTTGGRHRVDVAHLVMGLVLLGVVGAWALSLSDAVSDADLRWLLPLPWLVGGAAGLVAVAVGAVRRQRTADARAQAGTDTDTDTTHTTDTHTELTDELMTEETR